MPKLGKLSYYRKGGEASSKSKGSKICPKGKAWAKRTFDTYPSAYANMAASKYCKDEIEVGDIRGVVHCGVSSVNR